MTTSTVVRRTGQPAAQPGRRRVLAAAALLPAGGLVLAAWPHRAAARWLVNAADRIAARAGELSQPFVQHSGSLAQRVEVLFFLVRRMRRALVWSDPMGYRAARDDFQRLWQKTQTQTFALPPEAKKSLDDALARLSDSTASSDARALQHAVEALRN